MEPIGSPIGFLRIINLWRVENTFDLNLFSRPATRLGPCEQMPVSKWITGR